MSKTQVIILLVLNLNSFIHSKALALYDSNFLDVTIFKKVEEFYKIILNSNKISIVQFYSSSMCDDSCKNFKSQWLSLSKETKLWQKNIMTFSVVDCSLTSINKICIDNNIKNYPEFVFYHAWQEKSTGRKKESFKSSNDQFMRATIDFMELQRHWPSNWPILSPFTYAYQKLVQLLVILYNLFSSDLESIFDIDTDQKYIILIIEPTSSYLGRKVSNSFKTNFSKQFFICFI
jgi:hypothetical protein